jgi:uncharacterized RDD family membrane protein YckC
MTPAEHPSPIPLAARPFQGRRAGVVTRVAASAIDLLVVIAVLGLIYAAVAAFAFIVNPSHFRWPDGLGWSIPVIGFVIVLPYLTLTWRVTGRTYGGALLGLRVVRHDGRRMPVAQAALRALLCIVFPLGLLWVAISSANRSVQDVVLRTSVIYDWTPRPVDALEPTNRRRPAGSNSASGA